MTTSATFSRLALAAAVLVTSSSVGATACSSDGANPGSPPDASSNLDGASPVFDAAPDTGQSNKDAGRDASLSAQEQAYCDAVTKSNCSEAGPPASCDPAKRCTFGRMLSPQAMAQFLQCHLAPSCKSEMTCNKEVRSASKESQVFETDCLARKAECNDSFDDDLCRGAPYTFRADLAMAIEACIKQSCAAIDGCFKALDAKVKQEVEACMKE